MPTASAFNGQLSGKIEINRAISVPVPDVPEATNVVLVSELLSRLAAAERRIVRLELEHARNVAKSNPNRSALVKERKAHPLDRQHVSAGLLPADAEEDLFPVLDPNAERELVDEALATASRDANTPGG